jgi:hypothetical protein
VTIIYGEQMPRLISAVSCMAIAVAVHVSATALVAQSTDSLPANAVSSRVSQVPAYSTWIDRYASMLAVGAEPGGLPQVLPDPRIVRLRATLRKTDSLRALRASTAVARATECPMPVSKIDSGRVAEMKVLPRDSGSSSPWASEGRLIGCTNPSQR